MNTNPDYQLPVFSLVYWPSPVLKRVSEALVAAPDPEMVKGLINTMYKHHGAGLSAIQVGLPIRILVVSDLAGDAKVFVNPVCTEVSEAKHEVWEGCLSVPGFTEKIVRHVKVELTYRDEKFELHEKEVFDGFTAHVLQHELEHLDGRLYLDHLTAAKRSNIRGNMARLKKQGKLR